MRRPPAYAPSAMCRGSPPTQAYEKYLRVTAWARSRAAEHPCETADPLGSERSYYWRARRLSGRTRSFSGPGISMSFTPWSSSHRALAPINNVVTADNHPKFSIGTRLRSGPAGPIAYMIEVADSGTASSIGRHLETSANSQSEQSRCAGHFGPTVASTSGRVPGSDSIYPGTWSVTQTFGPACAFAPPIQVASGGGGGAVGTGRVAGSTPAKPSSLVTQP